MWTSQHTSNDGTRSIVLRSHHNRKIPRSKPLQHQNRSESVFGTKSYSDALQRAFNKAKMQIFFNPDMTNFVTLTYAGLDHTPEQVLQDVKILIEKESRSDRAKRGQLKYIYIMEYQKRGSIHVHMITNDLFSLQVNRNGYKELIHWQKGFSSVLQIKDFDSNFRPYLYLFKYMRKSQRIGKSFVHSSRNLNNFHEEDSKLSPQQWDTINQEYTFTKKHNTTFKYYKTYLKKHDTIASLTNLGDITCHEQAKLQSTRESAKLQKSRLPLLNSISPQHLANFTSSSHDLKWITQSNISKDQIRYLKHLQLLRRQQIQTTEKST